MREQTTLRIPTDLLKNLRQIAEDGNASLNSVIVQALHQALRFRHFPAHNQ